MPSRPSVGPDGDALAALSPHLAGIRLQEAAGRGRAENLRRSPACSATASAGAAPSRVHHARMVPGGEPYERADGGLRGAAGGAAERPDRALRFRGREADPCAEPERLTVAEAFARYAGIDLLATVAASTRCVAAAAQQAGHPRRRRRHVGRHLQPRAGRNVEPKLGHGRATILVRIPVPRPPSRARPARPARRRTFRALRLRRRARQRLRRTHRSGAAPPLRSRDGREAAHYGERYPLDEDFLAALATCRPLRLALGFDRLVMLATGAPRIDQVLWTPVAKRIPPPRSGGGWPRLRAATLPRFAGEGCTTPPASTAPARSAARRSRASPAGRSRARCPRRRHLSERCEKILVHRIALAMHALPRPSRTRNGGAARPGR